jgi:hypothetical protein
MLYKPFAGRRSGKDMDFYGLFGLDFLNEKAYETAFLNHNIKRLCQYFLRRENFVHVYL